MLTKDLAETTSDDLLKEISALVLEYLITHHLITDAIGKSKNPFVVATVYIIVDLIRRSIIQ